MSLEENLTHSDWLATWKLLHRESWRKYTGEANERILLEGAQVYRPCMTAFDRSFHTNRAAFTRTDGRTAEDDRRDAAERQTAQAAELEKNVVVTKEDFEYAASLSPVQLAEANRISPDFARKYRKLMRDFGFKAVPVFGVVPGGLR